MKAKVEKKPCRRCDTPTVLRYTKANGYELPVCRACMPMAKAEGW